MQSPQRIVMTLDELVEIAPRDSVCCFKTGNHYAQPAFEARFDVLLLFCGGWPLSMRVEKVAIQALDDPLRSLLKTALHHVADAG